MIPVWLSQATSLADALMSRELALTDIQPGATLLDLSKQSEDVSLEILSKVADALGPALYLNRDLLLLVTIGTIDTVSTVKAIAEAIDPDVRKSIRLGRITGESVIDRIEEFASQGIRLCDESGNAMLEQPTAPDSVLVHCPASSISDILLEGAQIVLSRTASPGTLALGAYGAINHSEMTQLTPDSAATVAAAGKAVVSPLATESTNAKHFAQASIHADGDVHLRNTISESFQVKETLPDLNYAVSWQSKDDVMQIESVKANAQKGPLPVTATYSDGHELNCLVQVEEDQQSVLKSRLGKFPSVNVREAGSNRMELSVEGNQESLVALASRLELLLHELNLSYSPSPLSNAIRPTITTWNSSVPREKMLFGQECLYLNEWLSK